MPKTKRSRQTRSSSPRKQIQPFSLILQPAELDLLRKLAKKEGTSIGAIVRRAIHTAIAKSHPEFGRQILESEADAFLAQAATRLPVGSLTPARRAAFRKQLVGALK